MLKLNEDYPLHACASRTGETVRRVSGPGRCAAQQTALVLPGETELRFCAANQNGRLRYVTGTGDCGRRASAVVVPPANRAPVADADAYEVDEDQTLDIAAPGVLDGDTDAENDPLTAILVAGPANAAQNGFTLNPDGSFSYEPDADFNGEDSFTYKANDGRTDGNTATVTITVNPTADPPTDIELSNASVDENEPSGTTVGTFSTTDPDSGDTHTYSLVSGTGDDDNGSFAISGSTLQTNAAFDFETKASYAIRVQTDDGNGGTFEKQLTITITDANDQPTDISLSSSTVSENQPSGTDVGTLSTTDEDTADSHTYRLVSGTGSADNAQFQITGSTLQTNATFDFETEDSYSIRIETDDGNGGTFEKQFTISVTNANDAPTDIELSEDDVDENQPSGTPVGTFSSTDQDAGDTFTYTLVGDAVSTDNASFQIVNGELQTNASFNFEVKNSYSIRVRTTDNGSPAQSYEEVFTISINDVNDAPEADDESFSGANRAVGNTSLVVNDSSDGAPNPSGPEKMITGDILDGDTDEDGSGSLVVVAQSNKATNDGGSVTIESDGDFTFHPKAGTSCTDTSDFFDYTVSDQNSTKSPGTPGTDTGRVTIEIQDCVWYVDSSLTSNGDGRSHSPFNTLNVSGGNGLNGAGGSGDSDNTGQKIFLYDGSYSGGLPLENGQTLFSQRHGLTVPDGGSGNVTLESAVPAGPNTTITGGLTLASGNTIQGIHLGNNASGAALSGTNVGTATMNTATSGAIDNQSGAAISITTGTLDMAFTGVTSVGGTNNVFLSGVGASGTLNLGSGSLSGASSEAFKVSGGSGSLSYSGTISGATGRHVSMQDRGTGTVTFGGAISGTGTGVALDNNDNATINFTGGLSLNTGTSSAFTATNGGTVNVTGSGNTLATTTGTALKVENTNISSNGLNFKSISAGTGASGPTNGIVLNGTGSNGGLTVSGGGSTARGGDSSGGTIQHTSGAGISLTGTRSPSFNNMKVQTTVGSGVDGTSVTNFAFTNGTIDKSGLNDSLGITGGVDVANIALNDGQTVATNNVNGVVTITGNNLTNSFYHGVDIWNTTGTIDDLHLSNNTVTSTQSTDTTRGSGIRVIIRAVNGHNPNLTTADIDGNTVTTVNGPGIQLQGGGVSATTGTYGTAANPISISGNTVSGFNSTDKRILVEGMIALVNHAGTGHFQINDNTVSNTTGTAISHSAFGNVTVTSEVEGNEITANHPTQIGSQGIGVGTSSSIPPDQGGSAQTPNFTVAIDNNVISKTDGPGILAVANDATSLLKLAIRNNDVGARASSGGQSLVVRAGGANGDNDVCLDISGNKSAPPVGQPQFLGIGLRKQGTSTTANAFGIEGLNPSPTGTPTVENHVNGLNPDGGGTLLVSATSGFTSCSSAP